MMRDLKTHAGYRVKILSTPTPHGDNSSVLCVYYTYPWHKGQDVVLLVSDGVFGVLLLAFFGVA